MAKAPTKVVRGDFLDTYDVASTIAHAFEALSTFVLRDQPAISVSTAFAKLKVDSSITITWTSYQMTHPAIVVNEDHASVTLGKDFNVTYINGNGSQEEKHHLNELTVYGDYTKVNVQAQDVGYVELNSQYNVLKNYGSIETAYGYGTNDIRNMNADASIRYVYIHDWLADSSGKFTNYGTVGDALNNDGLIEARGGKSIVQNHGKIYGTVDLQGGDDQFINGPGARAPDAIIGGAGNDSYAFYGATKDVNVFSIVEEANGGLDAITFDGGALKSYFGNRFMLPNHVETLIYVGSAKTSLSGNTLDNFIQGGSGRDEIFGGSGNDILRGGAGVDTLYGGNGSDTLIFLRGDTGRTAKTADRIMDFEATDIIDLSGWDANSRVAGMQDWQFSASGAFSGRAGELIYGYSSSYFSIMGDSNGDRKADLFIRFEGTSVLPTASNFDF